MRNEEKSFGKIVLNKMLIFEVLILVLGLGISIFYTCSVLKYDIRNAWFFRFAVVDIIFIIVTIAVSRKKTNVGNFIGFIFIFVFLLYGGYGAFCCMLLDQRMEHLSYYKGKTVSAEVDDSLYVWDGESVTYSLGKDSRAEQIDKSKHTVVVNIDNQQTEKALYDDDSDENMYLQIYGGGTGEWLILKSKN